MDAIAAGMGFIDESPDVTFLCARIGTKVVPHAPSVPVDTGFLSVGANHAQDHLCTTLCSTRRLQNPWVPWLLSFSRVAVERGEHERRISGHVPPDRRRVAPGRRWQDHPRRQSRDGGDHRHGRLGRTVDLEAALDAAAKGFRIWSQTSAYERAKTMRKAAELLRERADAIARVMTREQGWPSGTGRPGGQPDMNGWRACIPGAATGCPRHPGLSAMLRPEALANLRVEFGELAEKAYCWTRS